MKDMEFLFNSSSVVVDNIVASGSSYEALGLTRVWEGDHPFFKTACHIFAAGKGGVTLFARQESAHGAIKAFEGKAERAFHVNLLVEDIGEMHRRSRLSTFSLDVSDVYEGPCGSSFSTEFRVGAGSLWVEFTAGLNRVVTSPESDIDCVDSTAFVAASRQDFLAPLNSIGLQATASASNANFKVLGCINTVMMLGDWHYLEVNEPTVSDGVVSKFLSRMGSPGIFGTNFAVRDITVFMEKARSRGLATNTPEPILLQVEVGERTYRCANILTISPRSTGGGRGFILEKLQYPWELVG